MREETEETNAPKRVIGTAVWRAVLLVLLLALQDFLVASPSGEQDSRVQRERVVSCQKYPSAIPPLAKCRVVAV